MSSATITTAEVGDPERVIARGDVLKVLPKRPENSAQAAIIDFPCGFDASNGTGRMGRESNGDNIDTLPYDVGNPENLSSVLYDLTTIVEDGGWLFVFADDDVFPEFRQRVEDSDWTYRRTLVWDKQVIGMGYYHRVQHLPIIAATNGETDRYVKGRGTVFSVPPNRHGGYGPDWPTAKPPKLYADLTAPPVLEPGETLIEPFCGTAPGYLAAAKNGLGYWGCDIAETPIEIARDRMTQARFTEGDTDVE